MLLPPAVPALIAGGGALLKGLFGYFGNKKKAEEQKKIQQEQLAALIRQNMAQKGYWYGKEANRGARLGAANSFLQRAQGSFAKGAPNYALSPEELAAIQKPIPYPGFMPANPTVGNPGAGLGYSLLSGLAGQAGSVGDTMLLGKLQPGSGGGAEVSASGIPIGEDRGRICALMPSLPGCESYRKSGAIDAGSAALSGGSGGDF